MLAVFTSFPEMFDIKNQHSFKLFIIAFRIKIIIGFSVKRFKKLKY